MSSHPKPPDAQEHTHAWTFLRQEDRPMYRNERVWEWQVVDIFYCSTEPEHLYVEVLVRIDMPSRIDLSRRDVTWRRPAANT